ncbi:MAG: hypothetical protein ACUVQ8_04580 [Nitrososphaeria archaeon]
MPKRVYLSVPVIANRDVELAQTIADIVRQNGLEVTSYWVTEEDPGTSMPAEDVYSRDIGTLNIPDVLIADVSKPSVGVGMEIMCSIINKKIVICLHKKGEALSKLLAGMPGKTLIEYETSEELCAKLSKILNRLKLGYQ